jgi:hypothetical protein
MLAAGQPEFDNLKYGDSSILVIPYNLLMSETKTVRLTETVKAAG